LLERERDETKTACRRIGLHWIIKQKKKNKKKYRIKKNTESPKPIFNLADTKSKKLENF